MEKISKKEYSMEKRSEHIRQLIAFEKMKIKDLAELLEREPNNLSRDLTNCKVSDKTCMMIYHLFPDPFGMSDGKYNLEWIKGDDRCYMLKAETVVNRLRKNSNKATARTEIFTDLAFIYDYDLKMSTLSADTPPEDIDSLFENACTISKDGKSKTFTAEEWMIFQEHVLDLMNFELSRMLK